MADTNFLLARGFDAAEPLFKGRAVVASATPGAVANVTAEDDVILGVGEFDVSAAEIARGKGQNVHMAGIVEMEAAGAISTGALVALSPNGRAIAVNPGARVIGVCVGYPSTAAGQRISVLLGLPGYVAT